MNIVEVLKTVITELKSNVASLATISNYHAATHKGLAYKAQVANVALGAGASLYFEIITPNTDMVAHLKAIQAYSDAGKLTIEMIEAPTITDGTTPIVLLNRNRNSINTSDLTMYSDPSGISGGTELENLPFVATGPQSTAFVQFDDEWMAKRNAVTLIKITNDDSSAANVWSKLFWYEELE